MKEFQIKKIFYLFPEDEGYIYSWQRIHFFDELKRVGISIETFNPLLKSNEDFEDIVVDILKRRDGEFSMFMTAMNDYELSIAFIKRINELNLPTLLICWDNLVIPFFHKKISKYFDLVWLTSIETEKLFISWGANTVFLPYAANPYVFAPKDAGIVNKLLFIGSPHGGRRAIINSIATSGYDVDVYGNWIKSSTKLSEGGRDLSKMVRKLSNYFRFDIGRKCLWSSILKNVGIGMAGSDDGSSPNGAEHLSVFPPVSFENMIESYSKYSLSLSIIEYLDTFLLKKPVYKLHLRTFEIPLSGGLQITHRTSEIKEYFREDEEIVLYDSTEELYEKLSYYLDKKNENTVREMKKKAFMRGLNEHTWAKRFSVVYDKLYK